MYLPAYKQLPSDEKRKRIWDILFAWYLARNKRGENRILYFWFFLGEKNLMFKTIKSSFGWT